MSQPLAVFALYETRAAVETAADALINVGFPSRDISVLFPKNVSLIDAASAPESKSGDSTDKPARAQGVLSGALGVLAGLGMLAIPGLGPLVGEGTLKAGLAGLGVRSAVGDLARSLIDMGVPELEAKRYEDRLQQDAILVAVNCPTLEEAARATEIIKRTGGQDASTTSPLSTATARQTETAAPDANVTKNTASGTKLAKKKAHGFD
jgi:hypothetical protein